MTRQNSRLRRGGYRFALCECCLVYYFRREVLRSVVFVCLLVGWLVVGSLKIRLPAAMAGGRWAGRQVGGRHCMRLAEVCTLPVLITAARPAYAGTEGCYRLLVFFIIFLLNE